MFDEQHDVILSVMQILFWHLISISSQDVQIFSSTTGVQTFCGGQPLFKAQFLFHEFANQYNGKFCIWYLAIMILFHKSPHCHSGISLGLI
jgi:hypothetical protein